MIAINLSFLTRTSFWVAALALAGAWALDAAGQLTATQALVATAISVAAYSVSRGLSKLNMDLKAGWRTSEFWFTVVGGVIAALAAIQGTLQGPSLLIVSSIIAVFYVLSRGLAHSPIEETEIL